MVNELVICSICFGHLYAHHQELEAILVLLPRMVCNALVCWWLAVRCRAADYASGMRETARAASLIPDA